MLSSKSEEGTSHGCTADYTTVGSLAAMRARSGDFVTVAHCAMTRQAGLRVSAWHTGLVHDRELCCRVGRRCTPQLPRRYRMTTRADRRTVGCHCAVRAARTSRGMRRSRIRLGEFCDDLVLDCDGGVSRGGDDAGWCRLIMAGSPRLRVAAGSFVVTVGRVTLSLTRYTSIGSRVSANAGSLILGAPRHRVMDTTVA